MSRSRPEPRPVAPAPTQRRDSSHAAHATHAAHAAYAAFTLVELLVVIGIIALLISVLLPALAKSKEAANQVKCLSNMKQISIAIIAYANENKGTMPAHGGINDVALNNANDPTSSYDWIAWQRRKDFVTKRNHPGAADQNITYSGIGKYMGLKQIIHNSPDEAATVNPTADQMFRCPSDNFESRGMSGQQPNLDKGWYRYSYAANTYAMSKRGNPRKITQLRPGGQRLLLICEDEKTIDDGVFNPNPKNYQDYLANPNDTSKLTNLIASRHRLKRNETVKSMGDTYGNVTFADGHGEYMSRKDALRQRYTGNTVADPDNY